MRLARHAALRSISTPQRRGSDSRPNGSFNLSTDAQIIKTQTLLTDAEEVPLINDSLTVTAIYLTITNHGNST